MAASPSNDIDLTSPAAGPSRQQPGLQGEPAERQLEGTAAFAQLSALQMQALNVLAFPLLAVTAAGSVLFANSAAQAALRAAQWVCQQSGRIAAGPAVCEQRSVAVVLAEIRHGRRSMMLLSDRAKRDEVILCAMPLGPATPGCEAASVGLIWLVPIGSQRATVWQLAHIFGLTWAELRVLQRLAAGESLREAAASLHLSIHTARNHLKVIFRKTGRRTQSQLLALATRIGTLRFHQVGGVPERCAMGRWEVASPGEQLRD